MDIKILSLDRIEQVAKSWRLSRDFNTDPTEDIVCVDAPVNEMVHAYLHFQDFMILEREIFVAPRNHIIWARTSRVDDPLKFQVPVNFSTLADFELTRDKMQYEAAKGGQQDQWRMGLPLAAMTSWTSKISFRDLVKLQQYFSYLTAHPKVLPLLVGRLHQISIQLKAVIYHLLNSDELTEKVISTMKLVKYLAEDYHQIEPGRTKLEGSMVIAAEIPIALRAQVIRHRNVQFVDNYFQLLCSDWYNKTIGDKVKIELSATNEIWNSIASKRSCWIAQEELWKPILEQIGTSILPCANGICPYDEDARLRLTPADPGAPCPVHCDLNKIDKAPWRDKMLVEANLRGGNWKERVMS